MSHPFRDDAALAAMHIGRAIHAASRIRTHRKLTARERYECWAISNGAHLTLAERQDSARQGQRLLAEWLAEMAPAQRR